MPEILRGSERIAAGRGKEAIEAAHNNEIKAFMEQKEKFEEQQQKIANVIARGGKINPVNKVQALQKIINEKINDYKEV